MNTLPISITVAFCLWLAWATVSDGLFPLLTLKEPGRYGVFAVMAGLFSLIPLACIVGMTLTGSLSSGRVWPMAIAYFASLALLELIIAKKRGFTKEIKGKSGLRMSYRVPAGTLIAIFFAATLSKLLVPTEWSLALTMALAFPIGLIGRWALTGAARVHADEV